MEKTNKAEDTIKEVETTLEKYTKQMAENHALKIDENFWLVVKIKPKWMPSFLYRAVIKQLIEFKQFK